MNVATPSPRGAIAELRPVNLGMEPETPSILRQYMRMVQRRRWVIVGIVAVCVLLALVMTLLTTPKYTATTTVEIARESARVTDFQGVERESSAFDQEFYQTQYGLLKSRGLAERVATQLRLVDDPAFFERVGIKRDQGAFQKINGKYVASGRAERQRIAGVALLNGIAVNPTRLSRLVNIVYTSTDPKFAAVVANAWAENFIQTNLERKVQATSYGRNLLERQLAQTKQRLDEAQRQLVAYASSAQIINLPGQPGPNGTTSERSIVADDLAALNSSLAQAVADRIQAEARMRQSGSAGTSTEALRNQAINGLRQRRAELAADYQRLMVQFEPGYPAALAIKSQLDQLDRSIAREEGRVAGSVQADYREALAREQSLQQRVEQLKTKFLENRRRSIQYNIYQQEVDTSRTLYDGLLQRYKEIGVAGGVGVNNIAIVDLAEVPQRPSSPRLTINLAVGLLAGLLLGAATAFALEQIDESLAEPEEIRRRLGVPLLGSVPKLAMGSPREALLDRKSALVDAYIAIQTSLAFTTEEGVPRSFSVTSTRPAEGKSTTALALATTLARSKRRVILVDGDMRSPSVHDLGGFPNQRGLSNYLTGDDNISTLVLPMDDLGISAMVAGPLPPNAAELLTGTRLSKLIEQLLEHYDHVVIDSPPVMGLADAPLIGARVQGVVYAIESHGIRATLVKTALARLSNANVRILGGVLTKLEAKKTQYGYEYGYGYGRDDA